MSYRYRRAFCDTLFHCRRCRRQASSSHRTVNAVALTSSFAFSSATLQRHDRLPSQLSVGASAVTSLVTTKHLSVCSPSNDQPAMCQETIDAEQLPVSGYARSRQHAATPATDDSSTVFRSEEVTKKSGSIVGAVVVRAVLEHRYQNLPVLRRGPAATAASTAGNTDQSQAWTVV